MARLRGSRWQADVRNGDERLRPTFETEAKAEAWEAAARLAIEEGRPLPPVKSASVGKRDMTTLGSVFEHVKRTHWNDMRAAHSLIHNGKCAVDHFGAKKPVSDITSSDIDDYAMALADGGNARGTVNRKLSALSKMLNVAHEAQAIGRVPKINWRKEVKTRFRFIDDQEERALLAYWLAVEKRDQHDLTVFLLDTGARCFSEAVALPWGDINKTSVTFWETKTNRPRTVPLTSRCRDILERRRPTFGHCKGPFSSLNKSKVRDHWAAMRSTLGFHDVTPHTMRHTCCTRLVMGGVDIRRVMEWMGHSAMQTTMRYLQMKPRALEDIVHILEQGRAAA